MEKTHELANGEGIVAKILPNYFELIVASNRVEVTAKGSIKQTDKICVGDRVVFENSNIIKVHPRKNKLIRPDCSNIDCLLIVVSSVPSTDFNMLDLMVGQAILQNIKPLIAINKIDLSDDSLYKKIKEQYESICEIECVSAKEKINLDNIKKHLGDVTAIGGQSGVGKTSLVNAIFGLELKVGTLSVKTNRGVHTTKESYFFVTPDNKIIVDTAGFSNLNAKYLDLTSEDIKSMYPEITSKNCKFQSCTHSKELGCFYLNSTNARFLRYKEMLNKYDNPTYKIRKGGNESAKKTSQSVHTSNNSSGRKRRSK